MKLNGYGTKNREFRADNARKDEHNVMIRDGNNWNIAIEIDESIGDNINTRAFDMYADSWNKYDWGYEAVGTGRDKLKKLKFMLKVV